MSAWSGLARGHIRGSDIFDADLAEPMGWRVARLDGTHLDPAFRPAQTAAAILEILRPQSPIRRISRAFSPWSSGRASASASA